MGLPSKWMFLYHDGEWPGMLEHWMDIQCCPLSPMTMHPGSMSSQEEGGKSEGLDSDLGPDALLCIPVPALLNSPWLWLRLPAGGACVCGRNCPPPAVTPLEAWSQYWNVTWAAVIGQWLHPCTAALLTQGMIHKWFFSCRNGWQRPGNEPSLSEKSWSWAKGLAKISGRT